MSGYSVSAGVPVPSVEASRCLLCHDPPCSKACKYGNDPAAFVRSVRFDNMWVSKDTFDKSRCEGCESPCEKACIHYDFPLRIKELAQRTNISDSFGKGDLSVEFCGVKCENPFFLSSSVVASNYEMCARALDMGWAGIVFKTIGNFVPKEVSPRFDIISKESTPFVGFRNLEQISDHTLEDNLNYLRKLKEDYPSKVIVASIMGQTDEEWTQLAKLVTQAGVDIIECNFSCPHMSGDGLGSDVGQNPQLVEQYTRAVKKGTNIPILAKMTPNTGNMEPAAIAAVKGGADGLAAINTIKSITGLDLEKKAATLNIRGKSSVSGYSGKAVKPIALRFISDMYNCKELKGVPISGMGGVETWRDAAEFIMLGCTNIQVTTAVMEYGYRIIDDLVQGLSAFMAQNGYNSISEMAGVASQNIISADKLDRETVVYPKFEKEKCIGCGRCYLSCRDAGHQAIEFSKESRNVRLIGKKCVGCHLCRLVCPRGAIGQTKRVSKTG